MKICYVDESGTHEEAPVIVMVGVIADSQRLARTREEFAETFAVLGSLGPGYLSELKGADFYGGGGKWNTVDGATRHRAIGELCDWLIERKHTLALAAIDKEKFKEGSKDRLSDSWLVCALHIALQVQRAHQKFKKRKGQSFLVFDENKRQADALPDLLYAPPRWTDDFYNKKQKDPSLNQIIDTAFYAKSHQIGLVQIADLFAFVLRRYAEVAEYGHAEKFEGEKARLRGWVEKIASRLLETANRWPKKTRSECAMWYSEMAPRVLKDLPDKVA